MSTPSTFDLNIYQGESYNLSITATSDGSTVLDLTGYTFKSVIKEKFDSAQQSLSFSTTGGGGPNGVISVSAASGLTVALSPAKKYVWDLKMEAVDVSTPLLKGVVVVAPRVTR